MAHEQRLQRLEAAADTSGLGESERRARERLLGLRDRIWAARRLAAYFALTGALESGRFIETALRRFPPQEMPPAYLNGYCIRQALEDCAEALKRGRQVLGTEAGQTYARFNADRFRGRFAAELERLAEDSTPRTMREYVAAHCGPDFDDLQLPPAEAAPWLEMRTHDFHDWPLGEPTR
jgi:hypothetical protein